MCLRNLFGGMDCTWLLFIIIVLLLIDDCGECGCESNYNNRCC